MKTIDRIEKERRRRRVERGVSPAQRTKRSKNKGRAAKYPGKGERAAWKKEFAE